MPGRPGRRRNFTITNRLVENFLIPSLDSGFYGNLLFWVDKEQGKFKIDFQHKSNQTWTSEKGRVFEDWSRLKKRWDPNDPRRYVKAKQRLRAALIRNARTLQFLEDESHGQIYRVYKIHNIKEIRKTQACNSTPEVPITEYSGISNNTVDVGLPWDFQTPLLDDVFQNFPSASEVVTDSASSSSSQVVDLPPTYENFQDELLGFFSTPVQDDQGLWMTSTCFGSVNIDINDVFTVPPLNA